MVLVCEIELKDPQMAGTVGRGNLAWAAEKRHHFISQ